MTRFGLYRDVIDPSRPAVYWTNMPGTDGLVSLLELERILAGHSFNGLLIVPNFSIASRR